MTTSPPNPAPNLFCDLVFTQLSPQINPGEGRQFNSNYWTHHRWHPVVGRTRVHLVCIYCGYMIAAVSLNYQNATGGEYTLT